MTWVGPGPQQEQGPVIWGNENVGIRQDPDYDPNPPPEGEFIRLDEWLALPVETRMAIYTSIAYPVMGGSLALVDNLSLDVLSYGIWQDSEAQAYANADPELAPFLDYDVIFGSITEDGDRAALELLNRRQSAHGPLTMNPALEGLVREEIDPGQKGTLSHYIRDIDPSGAIWLGITAVTGEPPSDVEEHPVDTWPAWKAFGWGALNALGGPLTFFAAYKELDPESEEQAQIAEGLARDQRLLIQRQNAFVAHTRFDRGMNQMDWMARMMGMNPETVRGLVADVGQRVYKGIQPGAQSAETNVPGATGAPSTEGVATDATGPVPSELAAIFRGIQDGTIDPSSLSPDILAQLAQFDLDDPFVGIDPLSERGFQNIQTSQGPSGGPITTARDPIYRTSDIKRLLNEMTPAELELFENQMVRAGLISPNSTAGGMAWVPGSRYAAQTIAAMHFTLLTANRAEGSMDYRLVSASLARLGDAAGIQDTLDPKPSFARSTYAPLDYATMAQEAKANADFKLGRPLSTWEMNLLTDQMVQDHRLSFDTMEAIAEQDWKSEQAALGNEEFEGFEPEDIQQVDWQARFEEAFDKKFELEMQRDDRREDYREQQQNTFSSFNVMESMFGRGR
jgi:hypothetical protein